jgi:hypothetical protein
MGETRKRSRHRNRGASTVRVRGEPADLALEPHTNQRAPGKGLSTGGKPGTFEAVLFHVACKQESRRALEPDGVSGWS